MSSFIVIGTNNKEKKSTIENILKKLSLEIEENNPDLLLIEPEENKKSIGISQVKDINKFLIEKPYSHKNKVIVIENGELLTVQAQNALLKNLEEHPESASIILGVKTEKDVLDTVLSRCKRINTNLKTNTLSESNEKSFMAFYSMPIGERLDYLTEFSKMEKEEILQILEQWVIDARQNITSIEIKSIEHLIKIKKDLETTNANSKLILEYLAIGL